ncbi:type I restriction enzyme HsdR N-terminal domain-containing protein, partial [Campylobacter coli]|nr:type I restriction enzyme HsdR N-terminal domain-containing protein [Campylobacter coli]
MITKDNLKQVLENLGFKNKNENYVKTINNYTLLIDYKSQSINYPKEIKIHDKTTSNFSHPENFVVFECVHRLLEKGYKAEHLELEPKWNLGRDKKGGKADILVKDNEKNPYLIIECKTTDSKNSEFIKEWNRMQEDGGQLFSYFQQEKGVKYLCLYASDFSDKLEYKNYIIQAYDNEEYLKEKELQNSYKKSNNNIELFKTWKESYELQYFKQGIFEANVNAYKILEITPTFDNLKELKEEGKYHEFAKILRKHNISGKENAFDKLVNIFLCKIYDETFNKNNLKFGYFGVMADTYANMQDRLMWLYKEAMKEFLGEKITFVSNEDIEKDFKQLKIKTLK